jgi:hypothetical protein
MPGQTIGSHLILGEGDRDKSFIENLCHNRGITGLTVDFVRGNQNFRGHLTGLSAAPSFGTCKAILLVSDIDESATSSFNNIKQQLMDAGFPVPSSPLSMAQKKDHPSLAILMIPYPTPTTDPRGALETLLIPAMDSLNKLQAGCVLTMLQCAGVTAWGKKSSQDKAHVRSLIAVANEDDPMKGLQYCFSPKHNLVDLSHTCFDEVALVLRHLQAWSGSTEKEWIDWRKANNI